MILHISTPSYVRWLRFSHTRPCSPSRDEWLSQLVDELDETDSYEYLKHLTDVYRLHLFDAIMQYRAIFFDAPASQVWD